MIFLKLEEVLFLTSTKCCIGLWTTLWQSSDTPLLLLDSYKMTRMNGWLSGSLHFCCPCSGFTTMTSTNNFMTPVSLRMLSKLHQRFEAKTEAFTRYFECILTFGVLCLSSILPHWSNPLSRAHQFLVHRLSLVVSLRPTSADTMITK